MDNQVNEVKEKSDIVEIAGHYTELKRSGRNFKALCPFHREKTPSFMVSPDLQIWHCFGACGEGGDVISLLMKAENITFIEALRELAQNAGITLKNVNFQDTSWDIREKLFKINQLTAQYYHFLLTKHKVGAQGREYLASRNLNDKLINTFLIGYAPSSWDSLLNFLTKKGISTEDMVAAGVVIKSERGTFYDRFRSRIIFPLFDHRENIVGFSGRLLSEDEKSAKYINTPETAVYHKRETLYGLHHTKDTVRREKKVLIVEGEFDMLSCLAHGIGYVVAIKGSAFTHEQLSLLKRFTDRIIFALDSDFSGDEAVKRALHDAESLDFELNMISVDFAKDPDEALQKDPVLFKKELEKPIPVYDFIIDSALSGNPGKDANRKKRVGDAVIPFLIGVQNPILHSHYVRRLATELDLPESAIEQLFVSYKQKRTPYYKKSAEVQKKQVLSRLEMMQRYVLGNILKNADTSSHLHNAFEILDSDDFHIPAYRKIAQHLQKFQATQSSKKNTFDVAIFAARLPSELQPALQELYLFDRSIFDDEIEDASFMKALLLLKRLSLKKQIKDQLLEDNSDERQEKLASLTVLLASIEKKLAIN